MGQIIGSLPHELLLSLPRPSTTALLLPPSCLFQPLASSAATFPAAAEGADAASVVHVLQLIFVKFPAMRALSISSADAFILVYDVTDATTFEEVRAIRDQIHETKATTAVPIVVVGNKIDLIAEDAELREGS
ncbi:hypothetical protein ACLKA7_006745 [Drosophila subpalustris]